MNEPTLASPIAEFKDRRGGLIGFGILVIAIGCICALFVPLLFLGQTMSAGATGIAPNYRMIIPTALIYAVMAVVYVWLGVGSIMARRWARALLLILAWGSLLMGVIAIVFVAILLPKAFANLPAGGNPMPDAARAVMMIVMLGILSVFGVLLPGVSILFYTSRHVKATCETRDPVARWTDACPLPVLALSLFLVFGAVSMLSMLASFHSVIPFFGRLLSGASGTLLILTVAVLWGYCAWATYRLKSAGWWIVLISYGLMMASVILTFAQVDLMDMYRLMGYPEQEIARFQQSNLFDSHNLIWLMSLWVLPFFGYLLYVKKFFRLPA